MAATEAHLLPRLLVQQIWNLLWMLHSGQRELAQQRRKLAKLGGLIGVPGCGV